MSPIETINQQIILTA